MAAWTPVPPRTSARGSAAVAGETESLLERLLERQAAARRDRAAGAPARRHAPCRAGRRQAPAPVPAGGERRAVRRRPRRRAARRLRARTACIAIRWCTTICRPWTTTTCGAAGRPCTRPSTRRPRSWPATRCSRSPSTLMARAEVHRRCRRCASRWCSELARAAGIGGMAGGQMLDLAAEGRFETKRALSNSEIATLQAMKTGALIALRLPRRRDPGQGRRRRRWRGSTATARAIGQAFQIADDLLDLESDAATLGKAAGKDAAAGKATLVSALGRRRRAQAARRAGRRSGSRAGAVRRQGRYAARRRALHRRAAQPERHGPQSHASRG